MSFLNYFVLALSGLLLIHPAVAMAEPMPAVERAQQTAPAPSQRLRAAQRSLEQGNLSEAAELLNQATDEAQRLADVSQRDDLLRQISLTYLHLADPEAAIALTRRMSETTLSTVSCCIPLRTETESAIANYFFNTRRDAELEQFLNTIANEIRRDDIVLSVIRAGADRGELTRAIALLPQIKNPQHIVSAQHNLINRYGQTGDWDAGVALAQQMGDPQERAGALYTLTQTATQAGQYAQALTLASQIEVPQSHVTALTNLALAVSNVGDTAQAHRLMEQAYRESQTVDARPQPHWVDQFAQVRAYDRAIAILTSIQDSYSQSEGQLLLAQAYWRSDRLSDALELVDDIPAGQLQLPGGYPDPKVGLISDVVVRAGDLGQPDVIERGLALLAPIHQIDALLRLSELDPATAEARLDQAVDVALTIKEVWSSYDQPSPTTNAGLLLNLATRYADVGNLASAETTAQQAIQSLVDTPGDSIQTSHAIATLGAIAQLVNSSTAFHGSTLVQDAIARAQATLTEATAQDPTWHAQTWLALAQTCATIHNIDCATQSITQAEAIAKQHNLQALEGGARIPVYLALGQVQQANALLDTQLAIALTAEEPQRSFILWRQAVSLASPTRPELAFRVASTIPDPTSRASAWAELTHLYTTQNQVSIANQAFAALQTTIDEGWNPDERDRQLALSIQQLIQPLPDRQTSLSFELATRLLPMMTSPQARASMGLAIAQESFAQGAPEVAELALTDATSAAQQQPSLTWSTTLWENFQTALRLSNLALAEQIAERFDNPSYQINALRHLAHRYGRRGEIDPALAALNRARQRARQIKDLPTREAQLRAIATHQHWLEQ